MLEEDKEESSSSHPPQVEMELKQRRVTKGESYEGKDDLVAQKKEEEVVDEEKMSIVLGQVTLPILTCTHLYLYLHLKLYSPILR